MSRPSDETVGRPPLTYTVPVPTQVGGVVLAQRKHMSTLTPQWRPRVGDRVSVKGTKFIGTVQRIKGQRDDQRVIISDAQASRTVYWFEEIEPVA